MSTDIVQPNRGPAVLSVTVTTLCTAAIFVTARMVSRLGIVKHATWDDYTIILALAIAFGTSFTISYGTSKGLGKLDAHIQESWEGALTRCEYAFSILYNPALMATKTSILIFYLRMARNTNKLFRIASYATLLVVNLAGLVLTFLNIFQCRPLRKIFDHNDNTQKCIPLITLYLASSPVNIVTDLVILVLPIPILTRMSLPRKQKNILVATFGLGIFVAVVDVVRIYYLQTAMTDVLSSGKSATTTNGLGDEDNFEYNASYSLMWSAVEVNVGIICACVPTLKPLIKRIMPRLIDHATGSHSSLAGPESKVDRISPNHMSPQAAQLESIPTPQSPDTGVVQLPTDETAITRIRTVQEIEIDMLDFLTVAGQRPPRSVTEHSMAQSDAANSVYFGFVNMKRPKSMLQTGVKDSIRYCTAVTVLFFLWGFSYGLLNTLNIEVAQIANISVAEGLGLQSAYFGAYLFGPLTLGRYVLCSAGFRVTFIVGLCIYGTGTLMFWPSAVLIAYPGFVLSNFVVGFGLSILETAANPFLALCGPPKYGETRLLLAQGVQGVGSLVSSLIAEKAFFMNGGNRLIDVQWAYLAIAFFDVLLALFFYYMPLPEATDDELHVAAQPRFLPLNKTITAPSPSSHIGKFKVVTITLALAVFAQFLYVGVQETLSIEFSNLIGSLTLKSQAPGYGLALSVIDYTSIGRAAFAISRFTFGIICLLVRPRIMLLVSFVGAIAMLIAIVSVPSSAAIGKPNTIAALCIMLWFFEGPIFPLIYALGLRKLGRGTKTAAALITAGAFGGAVSPWFMYATHVSGGVNVRRAFFLLILALAIGLIFPLYLCLVPKAREQVDCVGDTEGEQADFGQSAMSRMSRVSANGLSIRNRAALTQPSQRRGTVGSMAKVRDGVRRKSVANVKKIVVGVRGLFGSHSSQGSGDGEDEDPDAPDLSRQY